LLDTHTLALSVLAELTELDSRELLRQSDLGQEPDPAFIEWLLELTSLLELVSQRRMTVLKVADFYRNCGKDLGTTKHAIETAPYGDFTPRELIALGIVLTAIEVAVEHFDNPLGRQRREDRLMSNRLFGPVTHHARPGVIHFGLSGLAGLQVAVRWEEHLAKCEGCRVSAACPE